MYCVRERDLPKAGEDKEVYMYAGPPPFEGWVTLVPEGHALRTYCLAHHHANGRFDHYFKSRSRVADLPSFAYLAEVFDIEMLAGDWLSITEVELKEI